MAETWTVNTGGRIYGPYTITQMQAFVAEGRLAPHSPIARNGETDYRPAGDDSVLGLLFRNDTGAPEEPVRPAPFGRKEPEGAAGRLSHYIIVADMKSRSAAGVEEEIFNLGPAYAVLPQVWLLTSQININALRNTLVQRLGKLDMLFIIDATNDRAAWFNFGPEADVRIRRLWARIADTTPQAGTA